MITIQFPKTKEKIGTLTLFLGASENHNITESMIGEAQKRKMEGVDVVVGYVPPNFLVSDIEVITPIPRLYRGEVCEDLDGDMVLNRSPQLVVVDDLAHQYALDYPYRRRWEDVKRILEASIDVYASIKGNDTKDIDEMVAHLMGASFISYVW